MFVFYRLFMVCSFDWLIAATIASNKDGVSGKPVAEDVGIDHLLAGNLNFPC